MINTLEKILNDGEKKGYFRVFNDGAKIEYLPSGHKENLNDPEEKVRAEYYFDLLEKYHYPAKRLELETEMPARVPRFFADIVIYEDDAKKKPYIVVECKKDGVSDAEFEQATKQAIGNARVLHAPFAICVAGNTRRAMETAEWNDKEPEKATITDIPISYGKIEEYRFKKGDPDWDLKTLDKLELKRTLEKSQNTLWAGGKRNPTVAFDELCKIIFVKIRDEKRGRKNGEFYDFQIKTHEKAESVYKRLDAIYQEAKQKDPEVFKESLKIDPEELYTVVGHLQSVSLSKTDLDTKGVAFEQFMEDFFKGKSGQFFTPREIVSFAVKMMEIKNDDLVLDPACGSGGFLLHALDEVRSQAEEYYKDDETEKYRFWHDFAQNNLFGIEINDSIARVAKMNMIIHDDGHTNVIGFDALEDIEKMNGKNRGFEINKFDVIVTNPPFGANVKRSEHPYIEKFNFGQNGKKCRDNQKTEILFIERCIDFLKYGTGRMAIVLPDGILMNSTFQYVRDFIMDHCQIEAIISLPQFTFVHYGAAVKSSLLFLRKKDKQEKEKKYKVFMAIADHIGYEATGKRDPKNDLIDILDTYLNKKNVTKKKEPETFFIDNNELQDRFDPYFYRPFFKNLQNVIENNSQSNIILEDIVESSVAGEWGEDPINFEPNSDYELCYVVRNTNFHNDFNLDFSDVAQRYIKKNKAEKLALKKGEILVEKSGGSPIQPVGRVAIIEDLPFDKPVVFSNFLQKMKIKENTLLPEYVFVYLQTLYKSGYMDYIQNQTTGIKNLRLKDFFKIKIVKPNIADQRKIAEEAINQREEAKALINKSKNMLSSISEMVLKKLNIKI